MDKVALFLRMYVACQIFMKISVTVKKKQETQISLTNLGGTIPYVSYGFLLVCYSNFVPKTDIRLQEIS